MSTIANNLNNKKKKKKSNFDINRYLLQIKIVNENEKSFVCVWFYLNLTIFSEMKERKLYKT
jgi:hypothetical protein